MAERKYGALIGPGERNPSQQQLDGERAWLAAIEEGFNDVRCKVSKPQKSADMRFA